jgi:hypothetical protein
MCGQDPGGKSTGAPPAKSGGQDTHTASTMSTTSEALISNIIAATVKSHIGDLVEPDVTDSLNRELTSALGKLILALAESQHSDDLGSEESGASTRVSKTRKRQSKAKSGNLYAKFVSELSKLTRDRRGDHSALSGVQVTVQNGFSEESSSGQKFAERGRELRFQGEPLQFGQQMSLVELYDSVSEPFDNGMQRAGIIWGLIGKEGQEAIMRVW